MAHLGINIGPNRDTKNKQMTYLNVCQTYLYADYITVNISSPNTEGLRSFHR